MCRARVPVASRAEEEREKREEREEKGERNSRSDDASLAISRIASTWCIPRNYLCHEPTLSWPSIPCGGSSSIPCMRGSSGSIAGDRTSARVARWWIASSWFADEDPLFRGKICSRWKKGKREAERATLFPLSLRPSRLRLSLSRITSPGHAVLSSLRALDLTARAELQSPC